MHYHKHEFSTLKILYFKNYPTELGQVLFYSLSVITPYISGCCLKFLGNLSIKRRKYMQKGRYLTIWAVGFIESLKVLIDRIL